jgi:hypothetical protein
MPENLAVLLSHQRDSDIRRHVRTQPLNESGHNPAMVSKGRHVQGSNRREVFMLLEPKPHRTTVDRPRSEASDHQRHTTARTG